MRSRSLSRRCSICATGSARVVLLASGETLLAARFRRLPRLLEGGLIGRVRLLAGGVEQLVRLALRVPQDLRRLALGVRLEVADVGFRLLHLAQRLGVLHG